VVIALQAIITCFNLIFQNEKENAAREAVPQGRNYTKAGRT